MRTLFANGCPRLNVSRLQELCLWTPGRRPLPSAHIGWPKLVIKRPSVADLAAQVPCRAAWACHLRTGATRRGQVLSSCQPG